MKNMNLFGIAAVTLAIILALSGCPTGNGTDGNRETLTYTSKAPNGDLYELTITESPRSAEYAPKQGDSYVLVITFASGGSKKSTGTIASVVSTTIKLKPDNSGSASAVVITVTISSAGQMGIEIPSGIKYDDNTPAIPIKTTPPSSTPSGPSTTSPPPTPPTQPSLPAVQSQPVFKRTLDTTDPTDNKIKYSEYLESGDVKLSLGDFQGERLDLTTVQNIGRIKNGMLTFDFAQHDPITPNIPLAKLLMGSDYYQTGAEIDAIKALIPDIMVTVGSLVFVQENYESQFYYDMSFGKETFANNEPVMNGSILYIYADKPAVINGSASSQKDDEPTVTQNSNYTITLVSGWNRVYDYWIRDGNTISEYISTTAPDTTTEWKWAIRPTFQEAEAPYKLEDAKKTLVFNIAGRNAQGQPTYVPEDDACDRWEHKDNSTFPANGKWYDKKDNSEESNREYIEFSSTEMTLHWSPDSNHPDDDVWFYWLYTDTDTEGIIRYIVKQQD